LENNTQIDVNLGGSFFCYNKVFAQKQLLKKHKLTSSLTQQRYLTFIQSDKPIYKPGDKIYFRGWVLNALSFTPLSDSDSLKFFAASAAIKVQILAPSDSEMFHAYYDRPSNSTIAGSWDIPSDASGGDYRIRVEYFGVQGFPVAERKFNIRNFSNRKNFFHFFTNSFLARMKLQLEFPRKGYGPSDEVTANLDVKRAEGGVPEGATGTLHPTLLFLHIFSSDRYRSSRRRRSL
jgi:uncharacterized protein YfaS (alpha-2-macroglobulin family)